MCACCVRAHVLKKNQTKRQAVGAVVVCSDDGWASGVEAGDGGGDWLATNVFFKECIKIAGLFSSFLEDAFVERK